MTEALATIMTDTPDLARTKVRAYIAALPPDARRRVKQLRDACPPDAARWAWQIDSPQLPVISVAPSSAGGRQFP